MLGPLVQVRLRRGGLIAVAAAGAAAVLAGCGSASSESVTTVQSVRTVTTVSVQPFAPRSASAQDLKTISGVLGQPIYWAGPRSGYTYEVSRVRGGNIFLRYLPPGTAVGTKGTPAGKKRSFLTIATYPLSDAYGAIVRASKRKGSVAVKIPNKGLAVYAPKHPETYYFAYPGSSYQVGVFAPTAAVARRLVLQGRVVPVS